MFSSLELTLTTEDTQTVFVQPRETTVYISLSLDGLMSVYYDQCWKWKRAGGHTPLVFTLALYRYIYRLLGLSTCGCITITIQSHPLPGVSGKHFSVSSSPIRNDSGKSHDSRAKPGSSSVQRAGLSLNH